MRVLRSVLVFTFFAVALALPIATSAQLWSGILESTHGADWSRAGALNNHSTSWTQCGATIAAYSGAASTITNALSACGANQYVLLGPGTFNLSSGITISKSNVALRGSGADQTFIVFGSGASTNCNGLGAVICFQGPNLYTGSSGLTVYNWTGGYAQGSTQVTLSSTSGISLNTTLLMFDQCDDGTSGSPCSGTVTDNGDFYVCSVARSGSSGCGKETGTNSYRSLRSQIQIAYATAINGNTVTLSDPIVAPQWRAGQTPQVWLYPNALTNSGIENLSVDVTAANKDGIKFYGCVNCWATGNRVINANKVSIGAIQSAHVDIQHNYVYGAQNSDPYCISPNYSSFLRIENNIIQKCRSQIVFNGPDTGSVVSYNYSINNWDGGTNYMWFAVWTHSSASMYALYEGNVGNGLAFDDIHGSHQMNTLFRNRYTGWEPGKTGQTIAVDSAAYARYSHFIGNVLGTTGVSNTYQSTSGAPSGTVFAIGGDGGPDAVAVSTSMRWGNWDSATNTVRFQASEVPSGDSAYPNSVPSNTNLPDSFYLTSKPSWWGNQPFPAIGPDVANGTLFGTTGAAAWATQSVAGHANSIPALSCYKDIMGGLADGSGNVLPFNSDTCYFGGSASTPPPAPPTGLTATVN